MVKHALLTIAVGLLFIGITGDTANAHKRECKDTKHGKKVRAVEFVGKNDLPNLFTWGVALKGSNLFMAGDEETKSLWILDVSDPAHPRVVSTYGPYYGFPQEIAVQGNYAYVPDGYNLIVFDISDLNNPQLVGGVHLYPPAGNGARDVVLRGNLAYVATGSWEGGPTLKKGFAVVDVSDPANPTILSTLDLPGGPVHLSLGGDYVYLAALDGGMQIVSVADPANPVRVAEYIPSPAAWYYMPGSVTSVGVSGTVAFVLSLYEPWGQQVLLTALDVRDPSHPQFIASAAIPGRFGGGYYKGHLTQITEDGKAFVVAEDTLTVLDVSDPARMNIISTFSLPTEPTEIHAEGVQGEWIPRAIEGILPWFNDFYYEGERNVGYLIDARWGLWTLDMGNLQEPRLLGALPAAGEARRVKVFGRHAYLSDYNGGLLVFDVANPKEPKLLGQYWDGDNYHNFAGPRAGLLYLPNSYWNFKELFKRQGRIVVMDVHDPRHMKKVRMIHLPEVDGVKMEDVGDTTYVYVFEDKLYVAHRRVLFIYHAGRHETTLLGYVTGVEPIKNLPSNQIDMISTPLYVRRCGKRVLAYVASDALGLTIADVTDARNPRVVGQLNRPTGGLYSGTTSIDVQGRYAYIAQVWPYIPELGRREETTHNGIWIVDVSEPENPRYVNVFSTYMFDPRWPTGRPIYVKVQDNLAWVADYSIGVFVWDVSDPLNPFVVQGPIRHTSVNQFSLDLKGGYMYRADVGTLEVYKVHYEESGEEEPDDEESDE